MHKIKHMLCFGLGYTAQCFAHKLHDIGWTVSGSTRDPEKAANLRRDGVKTILWDGREPITPETLANASAMLVSAAPGADGCPVLNALPEKLNSFAPDMGWIGYLSTNGVFGNHNGALVTEDSELCGTSDRARRRIASEQAWLAFGKKTGIKTVIFRLPGIYGPGRSALDKVRGGTARRLYKAGQAFSRMHVEDIAETLMASLNIDHAHRIFNLCDDETAPPQDVIAYACDLLSVEPPPLVPIEEADISPMARSFYADNKRISNARMKDTFKRDLLFPTYRDGLNAILKTENDT